MTPRTFDWQSDDQEHTATIDDAAIRWATVTDAYDDDKPYTGATEQTQTVADFLAAGPIEAAPIAVVEKMLAALGKTVKWLAPLRLQRAAADGDVAATRALLKEGAPPNVVVRGRTALSAALEAQQLETAACLLEGGSDPNVRLAEGVTALHVAAKRAGSSAWAAVLRTLVARGGDLEARGDDGQTPLVAGLRGHLSKEGVEVLVETRKGVNTPSADGTTALLAEAQGWCRPSVVRQLLAAGANINARSKDGGSALLWAISKHDAWFVKMLIDAKADVTVVGPAGKSALALAESYASAAEKHDPASPKGEGGGSGGADRGALAGSGGEGVARADPSAGAHSSHPPIASRRRLTLPRRAGSCAPSLRLEGDHGHGSMACLDGRDRARRGAFGVRRVGRRRAGGGGHRGRGHGERHHGEHQLGEHDRGHRGHHHGEQRDGRRGHRRRGHGGRGTEVLATLDDQPVALAVIGDQVYVALFSDGIVTVPTAGGSVTPIVASITGYTPGVELHNPFVFDHTNLYFAESSGGDSTGPVARAPVAGGTATVLASSMGFTAGIAVDGSNVYWVDQDQGTVNRVPIAGGSATQLASGLQTPGGLALEDGTLYLTDAAGDLLSVPVGGGSVKTLFTGPGIPPNTEYADYSPPLVADAENVYFSVCPSGGAAPTLYRAPLAGGAPTALASSCASGIAVDGHDVYWTEGDTVSAVPIAGGTVSVVAVSDQLISAGPAVDAASVYWGITPQLGSCGLCPPPKPGQINAVMKAPKPH